MKKLFSILLLFSSVCTFAIAERTLAVSTFDVVGNAVSKDEAEIITELYIAEFATTGWAVVPNRTKFSKVLNELKFQEIDWSDASKTIKLGNAMNADVISTGKIMKLKTKLYIVATLIDAKTAEVLSSSKVEARSVGDIPDVLPEFVTSLTRINTSKTMKGEYHIGDKGPGGGLVFYNRGNIIFEMSEILGIATSYSEAIEMCNQYRGGGYSDWYLPLADELALVYMYFVKWHFYGCDIVQDKATYWTANHIPESTFCWVIDFSDGERGVVSSLECEYSVRAVRAFWVSDF